MTEPLLTQGFADLFLPDGEDEREEEAQPPARQAEEVAEAQAPAPTFEDLFLTDEQRQPPTPGLIEQIESGELAVPRETPEAAAERVMAPLERRREILEQAEPFVEPEPSIAAEAARALPRAVGGLRRVVGSGVEAAGGAAAALGGQLAGDAVPVALQGPGRLLEAAGETVEEMGVRAGEQERLEEEHERPLQEGFTGDFWTDVTEYPLATLARDVPGVFGSLAGSILTGAMVGPGAAGPALGVSEQYSRAREEGQERGEALAEAGTAGMVMGQLERLSLSKLFGVKQAKALAEKVRKVSEATFTEAGTEGLQALVSDAGAMTREIVQDERPVSDLVDLFSWDSIRGYLAESALGAIGGAGAGTIAAVATRPAEDSDREVLESEFGSFEIGEPEGAPREATEEEAEALREEPEAPEAPPRPPEPPQEPQEREERPPEAPEAPDAPPEAPETVPEPPAAPERPREEAPEAPERVIPEREEPPAEEPPRPEAAERVVPEPEEAAPEVEQAPKGATSTVTAEGFGDVEVEYRLMPADAPITSHRLEDFQPDPRYQAPLQERARERAAMQDQVRQRGAALDPRQLEENVQAAHGAPILGRDAQVESGNGRMLYIREAIRSHPEVYDRYRQYLRDNAEKWGLSADDVDAIENPALVRVRTQPVDDRVAFAQAANRPAVERLGRVEQARTDARAMPDRVLELLQPGERGELNTAGNTQFLRQFFEAVTPGGYNAVTTEKGGVSAEGLDRARAAILQRAYDSSELVEAKFEDPDANVTRAANGLLVAAPRYVRARNRMDAGTLHPLDIASAIDEAIAKLRALRAEGERPEAWYDQMPLGDAEVSDEARELVRIFGAGDIARSARRVDLFMQRYVDLVEAQGDPSQEELFAGAAEIPSRVDLIRQVEQEYERGGQGELLEEEPAAVRAAAAPEVPRREEEPTPAEEPPTEESQPPESPRDLDDPARAPELRSYIRHLETAVLQETTPAEAPEGAPKIQGGRTAKGRRLLKRFQRDTKGRKVGPAHIAQLLNDAVEVEVRVGRGQTTPRNPAHYHPIGHIIRTRYPNSLAMAAHEAGHALFGKLEAEGKIGDLTFILPELEQLSHMRFSSDHGNWQEGIAELVRMMVMEPEALTERHVRAFRILTEGDSGLRDAVEDASRIWHEHRKRDVAAQWHSQGRGAGRKTRAPWRDRIFGGMSRIHGSKAFEYEFVRATRKAFGNWRDAKPVVDALLGRTEGTAKDVRTVYMFTNRTKQETLRAIHGGNEKDPAKRGLRVHVYRPLVSHVDWFQDEFETIVPSSGYVYLPGRAPLAVLADMTGEETERFKAYGQMKASLSRARKGHRYAGVETVELSPDELLRQVSRLENENPEWEGRFKEIEKYFRHLLALTVLSGERTPKEFEAMVDAYEHYWPLMKDAQDDALAARGFSAEPTEQRFGAGRMRATGKSIAPMRPLTDQIVERTSRTLRSFYWIQALNSMVAFTQEVWRDTSVPLAARRAVQRILMPVYEERKPKAKISPAESVAIAERIINRVNYNVYREVTGDTETPQASVTRMKPEEFERQTGQKKIEADDELAMMFAGQGLWRRESPGKTLHQVIAIPRGESTAYYQVGSMAPHLWTSIATGDIRTGGITGWFHKLNRAMQPFTNAFRRAATGTLLFSTGNAGRDMHTGFILGKGRLPGHGFILGMLTDLTGRTPDELRYSEHVGFYAEELNHPAHRGAIANFWEDLRRDSIADRPIADGWSKLPAKLLTTLFIKPWEIPNILSLQPQISLKIERWSRIGEAAIAAKRGADVGTQLRARDEVTGSFGEMAGNETLRAILRFIPFGNAGTVVNYQILDRLFINPRLDQRLGAWMRVGGVTATAAMLWAVNKMITPDDDEEALTEMPEETRALFFPVAGKFLVPFPYGIDGTIVSAVVNILEESTSDRPLTDKRKLALRIMRRAIDMPNPWTNMHPVLNGIIGQATNHRLFFGSEIVPWWMQAWAAIDQRYSRTPEFYVWAARQLQNLPGGKNVSPLEVQAFMETLGTASERDWMEFFSMIERGEPIRESMLSMRNPLLSRRGIEEGEFTGYRSVSVQRMLEFEDLRTIVRKRFEQLEAEGEEGSKEGRKAKRWLDELDHPDGPHEVWRRMSKLRREESDLIKEDPFANREEIQALKAEQTRLARAWLETHRSFGRRALKALEEYR